MDHNSTTQTQINIPTQTNINITYQNNNSQTIQTNKSLINIRSLKNKLEELKTYIYNSKIIFDVIIIAETWLNESDSYIDNIDNYNAFHNVRKDRDGGGVSIYEYTHIKHSTNMILECDDHWNNFILIEIKKIYLKILAIFSI